MFGEYKDADYDTHLEFNKLKKNIIEFASSEGVEFHSINSKYKQILNYKAVSLIYRDKLSNYSWWQKIQHGLFYISSTIPVCDQKGYGTLYVPSTFASDFPAPWGTNPKIINSISWSSGECQHDLTHTTRQEKWKIISNNVENVKSDIIIQSCEPLPCNTCQHCARNIVGMYIVGLDPEEYGYSVDDNALQNIRNNIELKRWELEVVNKYIWKDMQDHAKKTVGTEPLSDSEQEFFKWFKSVELGKYESEKGTPDLNHKQQLYRVLLNNHPILATFAERSYNSVLSNNRRV